MGFTGNIPGGGDVIHNGLIYVDSTNGDDATGERNFVNKPFQTIAAAYAVYQEGDIIRVLPGTYNVTTTLVLSVFDEVHFDFEEGAIMTGDVSGPLFSTATTTLVYFIHGRGEFRNDSPSRGAGAGITGGRVWIKGAKKISCLTGTLFGTSNGWLNIENVDDMYAEALIAAINFTNNTQHEIPEYGIIRNCKKIGDLAYPIAMSIQSQIQDATLQVEQCNFYGSAVNYVLSAQNANNQCRFTSCNFVNAGNFRAALVQGFNVQFNDCHFQNEGNSTDTVFVGVNDYAPTFESCTFRNNGTFFCIRTNEAAFFSGSNKMFTTGASCASGFLTAENRIDGTVYVNDSAQPNPVQTWLFQLNTTPPTVGEIYTIDDPDSVASINYTVLGGDTRDDVVNGLLAAWTAEAISDPSGFFAKFNNTTAILGPVVWRLQVSSIDPDDNLDPDNGFVSSTNGTDAFITILVNQSVFAFKGNGKFLVEENLTVPNI